MKIREDYDKEEDIISVNWGGEVESSIELFDGSLILDYDQDGNIVGMEIFDYAERIKEHQKKIDKLLKK